MGKTLSTAVALGLLIACGGGPASESSDGAMFRANLQRTGVYPSKAVRELTELKWKFKAQGDFVTSPAVSKGVIYFGSEDNNEDVGYLYAVDIETGKEKWNFRTESIDENISAPSVTDGVAYFGSGDKHLYAIDIQTGQEKWRFRAGDDVLSSPAIADNVAYFGSSDGYLYAVDIKTGQEKWKFKTTGHGVYSSPAIADGVVYFGNISFSHEDKPFLYAIDAFTGQERWKFELGEYDNPSTPCISSGIVYFTIDRRSNYMRRGVQPKDTHLCAFDAKSGELLWKFNMGIVSSYSPSVADGVVYFGSGGLFAINTITGKQLWKFKTGDKSESYGFSLAIAGGVVYFGRRNALYAVDAIAGELLWQFKTEGSVTSSPAIVDGVVYFGDSDGWLYAVR